MLLERGSIAEYLTTRFKVTRKCPLLRLLIDFAESKTTTIRLSRYPLLPSAFPRLPLLMMIAPLMRSAPHVHSFYGGWASTTTGSNISIRITIGGSCSVTRDTPEGCSLSLF